MMIRRRGIAPAWLWMAVASAASLHAQDPPVRTIDPELRAQLLTPRQRVVLSNREGVSRTVDPATLQRLQVGEALLWKSSDTASTVTIPADGGTLQAVKIPWEYRVARPGAPPPGGSAEDALIHAHPIVWPDGPLTFDSEARSFEGAVLVFLQDSVRPGARQEVQPALSVIFSSDADELDRESVELGRTGFPPERIRLRTRHPSDSVQLEIRTATDIGGFVVGIPVRPTVVIETPPRRVQGWGVGEFQVTVELHGPIPEGGVTLRPSVQGVVDSTGLVVGQDRSTQLTIRSQGLGTVPLEIDAAGFASDRVEFVYEFPYWFFGLGLLGAVLGAAFAVVKVEAGKRLGAFANRVGIGIAGTLAYFILGVQIFAIDRSPIPISEVAALTVALLAALVAPNLTGLLGGRGRQA